MQEDGISKIIFLYGGFGWKSLFSKIRFWDAPYVEVEKIVPRKGFIIDLGCGEGIFANFLGISSSERKVLGIEIDKTRLKIARRGVKNVSFKYGDATKTKFQSADAIVLFHVLHHLNSYPDQEKVLKLCFNQLNNKGKLIIVEAEPKFSFKFLLAWLTDHFLVPWIFERKFYAPIYFRKIDEWKNILKLKGFSCKIVRAEINKPFPHVILVCEKLFK